MLYNRDAEMAVLGSILIDPAAMATVRGLVVPDDFGDASMGNIYRAMLVLTDDGTPIDGITLTDKLLGRGGKPEAIGDLISAIAQTPTAAHAEQYAGIVADLATRRRLMQYSADVMALATDETRPASEVLGESAQRLQAVMQHDAATMVPMCDAINRFVDLVERRVADPDGLWGVPTSLLDLDALTNGLQPGMTILSGITHHGKTALAVQIAEHAAMKGIGVAWFSMEMTVEQMVGRFACKLAQLDADKVQKGRLTTDELSGLYAAIAKVQGLPVYFCERAGIDHGQLYAELTKLRMRHQIGLVVIDHLHLMRAPKAERLDLALGQMAGYIHQRGLDEQLPMLTLAQLNRAVDSRDVKIPAPSDLRNSGEIEQAASVIMFVHRPEMIYKNRWEEAPAEWRGMAAISVAKNRASGRTGFFKTRFLQGWGEFQSVANPADCGRG
jgi:replicative DNA helicase